MVSKLGTYGITGKDKELYQSYHKGRYQRFFIFSQTHHYCIFSNWVLIKHGVPQGSVLGPVLFLLYVNDLRKFINNKSIIILFAYDTSILFTHSNVTEFNANTHTFSEIINTWFKDNYL